MIHLLPKNLGAIASLCADENPRWAVERVQLEINPDGSYRAAATDGRVLGIVEGPAPAPADEYPAPAALTSAPNGATTAHISSADWTRAFKGLPKGKILRHRPALGNVAVVMGAESVTLATTDGQTETVQTVSARDESKPRFPAVRDAVPNGPPVAEVKLDAVLLTELLKCAAAFAPDCDGAYRPITVQFHGKGKPLTVRTSNNGQTFTGLIMVYGND